MMVSGGRRYREKRTQMKKINYTLTNMKEVAKLAKSFPEDLYNAVVASNQKSGTRFTQTKEEWLAAVSKYSNDPAPILPFKVAVSHRPQA
jgi:hypothetical protein